MFGIDFSKPSRISVAAPKPRPATKSKTTTSSSTPSKVKATSSTSTTKASSSTKDEDKNVKRTNSYSKDPKGFFANLQQNEREYNRVHDRVEYAHSKDKDIAKDNTTSTPYKGKDKINGNGKSTRKEISSSSASSSSTTVTKTRTKRGTRILPREQTPTVHSDEEDEMALGSTPPENMHDGYSDYRSSVSRSASPSRITSTPTPKGKKKVLVPASSDGEMCNTPKPRQKKRSGEDEDQNHVGTHKNKKKRRDDDDKGEINESEKEECQRLELEEEQKKKKRESFGGTDFFKQLGKLRKKGDYEDPDMTDEQIDLSKLLEDVAEEDEELSEEDRIYLAPYKSETELCPYCSEPFPSNPSANLLRQQQELYSLSVPKPTDSNPKARELSWQRHIEFCALHHAETSIIPLGIRAGYPESIDFTNLDKRLESGWIRERLDEITQKPLSSQAFRTVIKQIDEVGKDTWAGVKWQSKPENLDAVKTGYYGDLGRIILIEHFLSMRKWGYNPWLKSDTPMYPELIDPLSWTEFLTHILVPEASVLLIMDDHGHGRDGKLEGYKESEKIRKESVGYGTWKFREDDDDSRIVMNGLMVGKDDKKKRLKRIRKAQVQERERKSNKDEIKDEEYGADLMTPKTKSKSKSRLMKNESIIEVEDSPDTTPVILKTQRARSKRQNSSQTSTKYDTGTGAVTDEDKPMIGSSQSTDYDGEWNERDFLEAAKIVS
ncbi:hypothetical protein L486_04153 [Kwoniella mangroviensis CBS 10435]|uniref:Restriction of telomere capping protein 4 n=1 Tax=Kwoniella mangroviensis CBS 10435 TaxID=1331196 RepID=A0A1B9IRF5_9TREE|nr:hypothetical protein L486_04153 [Kwoniella mangroviensis CBS 10435]